jgi:hypothetical protein
MDETKTNNPTADSIFREYDRGKGFNSQINLEECVETNENFFIGKQWDGVSSNGLPTPVFNFLKRIVLFQVASILSDNIKMQASPLTADTDQRYMEQVSEIVSNEFDALFENNKIGALLREYLRNAAVDGDGCTYTYWDPDIETGQAVKGAIVTEIIENTRVFFGNPNERRVQRQPYIIIESREMLESVKKRAQANGISDTDIIKPEGDTKNAPSKLTDERVTVLLRLWKDSKTGRIWACESVKELVIRDSWDMGVKLYPITWLNWDYIIDCYHGQAMITGLIPNQIFVNKTYAMVQLSLMQSAFPKVIYDKTRVTKWTNQAGVAIGVNGGDMNSVARIIEPAQVSPQIAQFIDSTINYTQTFLGATSAATGEARPDNTSAIIALQRASAVPSEITKQNLYQSVEDLGRIYIEFMTANYGIRVVKAPQGPGLPQTVDFDFGALRGRPLSLKLDVGASSYWSEIAAMQTMDNLLSQGKIDIVDYLERIPDGYISKKQELIDKLSQAQSAKAVSPNGFGLGSREPEAIPDNMSDLDNFPLTAKVVQGS